MVAAESTKANVLELSWRGTVQVDIPIQLAGVASCRFVVVAVVCMIFGIRFTYKQGQFSFSY